MKSANGNEYHHLVLQYLTTLISKVVSFLYGGKKAFTILSLALRMLVGRCLGDLERPSEPSVPDRALRRESPLGENCELSFIGDVYRRRRSRRKRFKSCGRRRPSCSRHSNGTELGTRWVVNFFIFKMGHSRPLFRLFSVCSSKH